METAEAVLRDYSKNFMLMRRASWEEYLRGRRCSLVLERKVGGTYEAPWPYNLLDAIVRPIWSPSYREDDESICWKDLVSEDQMRGLEVAMESLSQREKDCILFFFRDGLNLEEVGKRYDLTRERIRQIIAKGIRKLRHPSRSRLISLGVQGSALQNENKQRRLQLEAEKYELDAMARALDFMREGLCERAAALSLAAGKYFDFQEKTLSGPAVGADKEHLMYLPIDALDLSVRSWNCCKRAGINTVGELIDRARLGDEGGLLKIRNLGKRSLKEILEKIRMITGINYAELYDLYR